MLCFPQAHQLEVLFRDVTFGHNFSISSLKARGTSSVGTGRTESALHLWASSHSAGELRRQLQVQMSVSCNKINHIEHFASRHTCMLHQA